MRKLVLILAIAVMAASASAVIEYSTDFSGNPGDDPLADGGFYDISAGRQGYTGTGQYNLTSDNSGEFPGFTYVLEDGDFVSEISISDFSASTGPTDTVAGNYEYTEFIWNTYDENGYMSLQVTNFQGSMYFKALEWDNALGWINYVQPVVTDSQSITSVDLRETWIDDPAVGMTGEWTFEYNLNGEGWTPWHTIGSDLYTDEASPARWGQFYAVGHRDYADPWYSVLSEISVDVDSYSVQAIPEPMTLGLLGLGGLIIRRRRA